MTEELCERWKAIKLTDEEKDDIIELDLTEQEREDAGWWENS